MLFNSDWYKPILREDLSFYMEQFFANGENDLIYAKEVEVDVPNVSKFSQGIYDATIKQMQRKTEEKIKPIAVAFRDRSSDLGLPLAFWEYHCLALHRYLLLAYLFYKFPETIAGAHPERQTNLMRRRKSLGAANYSQLHVNYKEYVLRMLDTGMYCANFQKLRGWILAYIQGVSKGAHGLREFFDKSVAPAQIEGYYIGLDARHVVSLFKCGGSWFFYDIDVGCKELSAADSAALAKSRIVGIYFEAKNNGTFEYTFMLENDESVQLNMPFTKSQWNSGSSNPYQTIATGFSMIMVAESGAASASGGGKRRRRGAPRKTRRAKLSRRNTKRK
jgi:hypothetical protein